MTIKMCKIFLLSCFIILLAVSAVQAQAADTAQAVDGQPQDAAPVSAEDSGLKDSAAAAAAGASYGMIGINAVDVVRATAVETEKALLEVIEDKKLEGADTIKLVPYSADNDDTGGAAASPNAAALVDAAGTLTVNVFDAVSGEYINDASVSITSRALPRQTLNTNGATTFAKLRPGNYQVEAVLGARHPQAGYFKPARKASVDIPPSAQLTSNIYLMPKKMPDLTMDVRMSDVSYTDASVKIDSSYKILKYRAVVRDVSTGAIHRDRDMGIVASPFALRLDNLPDGRRYTVELRADFLSEVSEGSVLSTVSRTVSFSTAQLPDFVISKFEVDPELCSKERNDTITATARFRLYHDISLLKVKIVSGHDILYSHIFSNLSKGTLNMSVPISVSLFSAAGEREVRLTADAEPGLTREKKEASASIVDNAFLVTDIKFAPARPGSIDELASITVAPLTQEREVFNKSISRISVSLSTSVSEVSSVNIFEADAVRGDIVINTNMIKDLIGRVNASLKTPVYIPDLKIAVRAKTFYDADEVILGERVFRFSLFEEKVKPAQLKIEAPEVLVEGEPFEFTVTAGSPARFNKLRLDIAGGADDSIVDVNPAFNDQSGNFEMVQKFRRTYTFDAPKREALLKDKAVMIKARLYYVEFDRWSDEYSSAKTSFVARQDFDAIQRTQPRVDLVILQDMYALEKSPLRLKVSCAYNFSKVRFDFGDSSEPEILDVPVQSVDGEKAVEIGHVYKREGSYPLKVSVLCSDYGVWSGANEFYTIKVLPLRGSEKQ